MVPLLELFSSKGGTFDSYVGNSSSIGERTKNATRMRLEVS